MVGFLNYFSSHSSDPHPRQSGDVCIANISLPERRKRARFAIWQLMVSLLVLAVLIALDVDPLWRLSLFFMFSAAATSYMQALDKT